MGSSMDSQATSPTGRTPIAQGPQAPGPGGTGTDETPTGVAGAGATAAVPTGANAGLNVEAEPRGTGFVERGRMRRRVRYLRKARELAYRDLGGLVFEMHRLGQRHDELVAAKLSVLSDFDAELRALERVLGSGQPITVLREAGIAACPRCAAIHGGADHFCPACGLAMGRNADRPIAATPATPPAPQALAPGAPATALAPVPQQALPGQLGTPQPTATPPVPQPTSHPSPAPVPASTPPPRQAGEDDRPTEIIRPPDRAA
jgi:hypothetical protein